VSGAAQSQRCGVVAIVGAPNAGKSTLVNALVGAKVAIVSPKVQTTRARLLGIAMAGDSQLLLTDTPGIFSPRRRLDRAMVSAAWEGARDADLVVLVVDAAKGLKADVKAILAALAERKQRCILALNKVDICPKDRLLTLTAEANNTVAFMATFMVSAETGDGIDDLKALLAAEVPAGPWHFPEDQLSDVTQRLMAAEITREKIYLNLHQELPYALAVETEQWEDRKDGSAAVHQVIYVERDSQKAIVLGKGGSQIKKLGELARLDMAEQFGRKVHLFLHVKVKPDWQDDREVYRAMGLGWVE
jgi:GTPase